MSSNNCGQPVPNTDISGIGVRISFYLQALFLAFLAARSGSADEITGALYTLVITNMAYAVTSLLLGFKAEPSLTFYDALVVFYLLSGSWCAVFFALAPYNRFKRGDAALKYLAIFHSYILFAYGFAILGTAPHFGLTPNCNASAVVVLFRPFSALKAGRIVGGIVLCIVVVVYTSLVVNDYRGRFKSALSFPHKRKEKTKVDVTGNLEKGANAPSKQPPRAIPTGSVSRQSRPTPLNLSRLGANSVQIQAAESVASAPTSLSHSPWKHAPGFDVGIDGRMLITLSIITVIWALVVMNTELLIRWNNFQSSPGPQQWQFGQILPMFLIVLPLVSLLKAFTAYGFRRRPHKRAHVKKSKINSGSSHLPPHTLIGNTPQARVSEVSLHNDDDS